MSGVNQAAFISGLNALYADGQGAGAITPADHRTGFSSYVAESCAFHDDFAARTVTGTDTYAVNVPEHNADARNVLLLCKFTNANTGAATLNITTDAAPSGIGALAIKKHVSEALVAGDIVAGGIYLLAYDGTNYQIVGHHVSMDVEKVTNVYHDFDSGPGDLSLSPIDNGGGAGTLASSVFGVDNTEKCSGVIALSTSTSTAGGAALTQLTSYQITFGFGFEHTMKWRIAIDDLSDGTQTFIVHLGFIDNSAGTPVDGAYFRYTHSVNSGKWEAVTVSNSTETAEDTGITAEVDIFHVFEIRANSAGTQVDFYIDGAKTNDITTNVINSSARVTGKVCTMLKTAGSTARLLYVDYYQYVKTRATLR